MLFLVVVVVGAIEAEKEVKHTKNQFILHQMPNLCTLCLVMSLGIHVLVCPMLNQHCTHQILIQLNTISKKKGLDFTNINIYYAYNKFYFY